MSSNDRLEKTAAEIKCSLDKGNLAEFETHGFSMVPLLHDGGDKVVLKKASGRLSVNDVAFCKTDDGRFVLHRVIGFRSSGYILKGDNCQSTEYCKNDDDVVGVAITFIRRNKEIDVSSFGYRFYVIFRKPLLKLWQLFWRCADKILSSEK